MHRIYNKLNKIISHIMLKQLSVLALIYGVEAIHNRKDELIA